MIGIEAIFFDFLLSFLFGSFPLFAFLPEVEQAKDKYDNGSNRYNDGNSDYATGRQSAGFRRGVCTDSSEC